MNNILREGGKVRIVTRPHVSRWMDEIQCLFLYAAEKVIIARREPHSAVLLVWIRKDYCAAEESIDVQGLR